MRDLETKTADGVKSVVMQELTEELILCEYFKENDWEWMLAEHVSGILAILSGFKKYKRIALLGRLIACMCSGSQKTYDFACMFRKIDKEMADEFCS